MQALLDRQRRAQQAAASRSSAFYDDDGPASKKPRTAPTTGGGGPGRQEGKPEALVLGGGKKKDDGAADDEEAMLRAMLPGGFGGVKPGVKRDAEEAKRVLATQGRPSEGPTRPPSSSAADDDGPVPGPQRPPPTADRKGKGAAAAAVDEDEDDDDDDAAEGGEAFDEYQDELPLANEVAMEGHKKFVSALALEHTGSRLLTGSHDNTVRIYDFNGMKRDMKAFRDITPHDGYPVHALSWSPTGGAHSLFTPPQFTPRLDDSRSVFFFFFFFFQAPIKKPRF